MPVDPFLGVEISAEVFRGELKKIGPNGTLSVPKMDPLGQII